MKHPLGSYSILISILALGASGCTRLALNDAAVPRVATPVGITQTKSMGETLLTKYACPCYEYYETTEQISFNDYDKPAAENSEWVARYIDPASREKYLVNSSFHPALALVLTSAKAPTLSSDHALMQVQGKKQGRSWALSDPGQADAVRLAGYIFSGGTTWRLQYIGTDKDQSDVLRFTIDDLRDNRERVGQIEYAHDLRKGREFVIRGVRLRIVDVSSDGLVTYVVVADEER